VYPQYFLFHSIDLLVNSVAMQIRLHICRKFAFVNYISCTWACLMTYICIYFWFLIWYSYHNKHLYGNISVLHTKDNQSHIIENACRQQGPGIILFECGPSESIMMNTGSQQVERCRKTMKRRQNMEYTYSVAWLDIPEIFIQWHFQKQICWYVVTQ